MIPGRVGAVFRLVMEHSTLEARELSAPWAQRTAMVEKFVTSPNTAQDTSQRNVVSLSLYRERNGLARAMPLSPRTCRHCGAVLLDGEREEECSSTFNVDEARLRWQAAQILRGLV
jgi:hypothetical protein